MNNDIFNSKYYDQYRRKGWLGLLGIREKRPFMNSYWKREIRKFGIAKIRILDIGCGIGEWLMSAGEVYPAVGCDLSYYAVTEIKQNTKTPVLVSDALNLPFNDSTFSIITAFDVIEHLADPEVFLKSIFRVLQEDGVLIFSTPNPNSFGSKIKGRREDLKMLSYDQRAYEWFGWRDDTHINIKSIAEWRVLLEIVGWRIVRDGSDTLWDIPYFPGIPYWMQKVVFISLHWSLTYCFGFFPWTLGENYVCIGRKDITSQVEYESKTLKTS